jgi:Zn-dependent protease
LVSFALAAIAFAAMHVVAAPWLVWLASPNAMLGAFNLIPALPMDGGRVLRALLAKRKGYVDGTRIAVTVARVCSIGIGVLGAVTHAWMLVALAILVWAMGTRELRSVT